MEGKRKYVEIVVATEGHYQVYQYPIDVSEQDYMVSVLTPTETIDLQFIHTKNGVKHNIWHWGEDPATNIRQIETQVSTDELDEIDQRNFRAF